MKAFLRGGKKCDGKFPSGKEVQEGKLNQLSKEKVVFKLSSVKLVTGKENWKPGKRRTDELRS
jgi:hypothetical protein